MKTITIAQLKQEFKDYYELSKAGAKWQFRFLGITYRGSKKALEKILAHKLVQEKKCSLA